MLFITCIIIFITLLNIIVYFLRIHHEEDCSDRSNLGKSSWGQSCRRFSLAEIKLATQNFDEGLVLGKGGFGKVYKGIIDNGKITVAIKRLGFLSKQGTPEFWTEIQMLSKFRHSHLVSLIGYCNDQQEMVIVYEYLAGGNLDDNLHKIGRNSPLSWMQRLKICIGAARGLDYLHTGTGIQTRVIHHDVKSSNILLDGNLAAKISDFGLSVTGPANQECTHVSTNVKGTFGYLDPEYFLTRRPTRKSDVYAFGVVLFEVLSGRRAVDVRLDEEQWGLALWAKHCLKEGKLDEIVDPSLRGNILPDCLKVFSETAEQCLQNNSKRRPTKAEVVTRLEFALSQQERTPHSTEDAETMSNGEDKENQENADSSTKLEVSVASSGGDSPMEEEVINAGNFEDNEEKIDGIMQVHGGSNGQSHPNPAKKMTFIKKVWLFFSTKPEVITGDYVNQENANSSTKLDVSVAGSGGDSPMEEVTNAGNFEDNEEKIDGMQVHGGSHGQSHPKPAKKMTFIKKVRLFFSSKPEVITGGECSEVNRGFSVQELLATTNNFSSETILGRGRDGYNITVYRGLLADGSLVAIKRLQGKLASSGKLYSQRVFEKIYLTSHPNLLRLLGFCMTPTERLLVYPYMRNRSLASCINEGQAEMQSILDWTRRKQIALGSARGIAYLHDECNPKIIHRDIRAGNIFLDDDFEAVVADFGLAVSGTIGHIAPEYFSTGNCSLKTDIFGYGAMLLELISGRMIFDLTRFAHDNNLNLIDWVREMVIDKNLGPLIGAEVVEEEMEQLIKVIQVAVLCTQKSPMERPKMSEVVKMLESDDGLSERWQEYLQNYKLLQQEFDDNLQRADVSWILRDSIGSL